MSTLAAIRPDEWNLALFVHVLGAFVFVGALVFAAARLFAARREQTVGSIRLAYRSLLLGVLPAYLVMRVGAQWIAVEEGVADSEAAWIAIGYVSTDLGLLLLLVATVLAGLAARGASGADATAAGGRGVAVAAWLITAMVAVSAVAIWAMSAKPA